MKSCDIVLEVCQRPAIQARYPYARAFLDGSPQAQSHKDVERLLKLMAYDLIFHHGHEVVDPSGVYITALRTIHATQASRQLPWKWEWNGFEFEGSLCDQERFAQSCARQESPEVPPFSLMEWRACLDTMKPLEKFEDRMGLAPAAYPSPDQAILMSALMALEVADCMVGASQVSVWVDKQGKGCHTLSVKRTHPSGAALAQDRRAPAFAQAA